MNMKGKGADSFESAPFVSVSGALLEMMLCPADTNEKIQVFRLGFFWRRLRDLHPRITVLQTGALLLG